jgi:GT2 family glycosyltransferase
LPQPKVTVVVPTLAAGEALAECLNSLDAQTYRNFETIVVDNSGVQLVKEPAGVRVIANGQNVGFGAAINQGLAASSGEYLAALNDDAVASSEWLLKLVECAESDSKAGMFASEVLMSDSGRLDSAGMLIATDGTSRQRGHEESPDGYVSQKQALFPSGSAALYRRKMLDEIGAFEESFFLYCEDTDLGLRARWAGWGCRYVPGAIVTHRYSHSAGKASILKAYYVERNRLFTVVRNFPLGMCVAAPFAAVSRYFWHLIFMLEGRGKAAEFRDGNTALWLPFLVLRAHAAMLIRLPKLIRERRKIASTRRVTAREFRTILAQHAIAIRKAAAL